MKKIICVSFCVAALISQSCNKQYLSDDFVCMDDVISVSKTVTTEVQTKSGNSVNATIVFSADYSISKDKVISINLSAEDEIINDTELNDAFRTYLTDQLGVNYADLSRIEIASVPSPETTGLGSCLKECKAKYEKHHGRGSCKFDCWVDFAVKVLPIIVSIIDKVI